MKKFIFSTTTMENTLKIFYRKSRPFLNFLCWDINITINELIIKRYTRLNNSILNCSNFTNIYAYVTDFCIFNINFLHSFQNLKQNKLYMLLFSLTINVVVENILCTTHTRSTFPTHWICRSFCARGNWRFAHL